MDKFLKSFEFERSYANPTLFVEHENELFVLLLVYVDDVMIFGSSDDLIGEVVDRFKAQFEIRVKPEIEKFLDVFVVDKKEAVKFCNQPMTRMFLKLCGMSDCETVKTLL